MSELIEGVPADLIANGGVGALPPSGGNEGEELIVAQPRPDYEMPMSSFDDIAVATLNSRMPVIEENRQKVLDILDKFPPIQDTAFADQLQDKLFRLILNSMLQHTDKADVCIDVANKVSAEVADEYRC